jgi:hypothetical protein
MTEYDVTADDVERLVAALPTEARRAFDAMADEVTRMEISRARILNDHDQAALYVKLELNGEISGLRKGICCLLGIPLEESEHEEAVDTYMRGRWEEQGWEGWPQ